MNRIAGYTGASSRLAHGEDRVGIEILDSSDVRVPRGRRGWHVRKECAAKARNHSRVAYWEQEDDHESEGSDDDDTSDEDRAEDEEVEGRFGQDDDLADAVSTLESAGIIDSSGDTDYAIKPESMPAMCALYFDQFFRHQVTHQSMPEYLSRLLK